METTTIELLKTAVAAMAGCLIVVVAMSLGSERFLVWRGKRRFDSRMKDKIRGAMHEKEIYLAKFEYAYGNLGKRDVWPWTIPVEICECCTIFYLSADPLLLRAYELASGVVNQYKPWTDISRYAVYCGRGNVDHELCPVFKILREMCAADDGDLVSMQPCALVAYRDDDGRYGDVGITYFGNGDGRCGPVSVNYEFREWRAGKALEEACKACQRNKGSGGEDKTAYAVEMRPEVAHGGIIPFLKRLFGGRKS